MRKTKIFEGKKHIYDTTKAEALGNRAHSFYGDPAGYEEKLKAVESRIADLAKL